MRPLMLVLLLTLAGCAAEPDEAEWQAYLADLQEVEAHGMAPANPGATPHPSLPMWFELPSASFDGVYGEGTGRFPDRRTWRAQRLLARELESKAKVAKEVGFSAAPASDDAIDYLIGATRSPDWAVRAVATLVVGELPHLGRRPEERPRVSIALVMRAKDENAVVRAMSAQALGMLIEGPDDGRGDALEALLGDPDAFVRHNAACALARIGQAPPTAIPILRAGLHHESWWVVAGAAAALMRIGFPAKVAEPELLPLLRHPNPTVRGNAYSALERLDPAALRNNPDAERVRKERNAVLLAPGPPPPAEK